MYTDDIIYEPTSEFNHACAALNYDLDTNTYTCLFGHKTIKTCGECLLRYGATSIDDIYRIAQLMNISIDDMKNAK